MALVKATRLLNGLKLRSLCTGGACIGGATGLSSKRFFGGPRELFRILRPFLASYGLRDRRAALRLEYGLRLRSRLPRYGEGDFEGARFVGGEAARLPLEEPLNELRSSDVSMGSGVLDGDLDTEKRRAPRRLSLF